MKYRDFSPGDPLPADFADALNEFISTSAPNFLLRIKPGDATTLQVVAGTGNAQVGIGIAKISDATKCGWRFITSTIERTSPGGVAATFDVHVTGSDNVFTPSGGGEVDTTDYSFALAIVAAAATPAGVALTRKVATAVWDGTKFTAIDVLVGPQSGTGRHAARHATTGDDPITPASLGLTPSIFAAGDMKFSAVPAAPTGWAIADGSSQLRADPVYAALFTAIGTTYGTVDGTHFNLPDMRGRVPVGVDGAAGRLSANDALGQSAGEETHLLTGPESGTNTNGSGTAASAGGHVHTHKNGATAGDGAFFGPSGFAQGFNDPGFAAYTGGPAWGQGTMDTAGAHTHTVDLDPRSADTAHNNMQPYLIGSWFIKL